MIVFKRKRKKLLSPTSELFDSMVGEGTEIHGRIVAHASIRIDGTIHGDVEIPEGKKNITIAVGANGQIFGDIKGFRVLVGGLVEGNIYATERVELHGMANVKGDISYSDIGIEPGAQVVGLLIKRTGKKTGSMDAQKVIKKIQQGNK